MEKFLRYRSQMITVRANKKLSDSVTYEPQIYITNAVHLLNNRDKFPPKGFPTAGGAIEYGLEAAKWLVDRGAAPPTRVPGWKKKEEEK
jgi:hypothetical protein